MAKLNLRKTIEQGEKIINPYYDLQIENIYELEAKKQDRAGMICDAFVLGYVQGVKATKVELKKKGALI